MPPENPTGTPPPPQLEVHLLGTDELKFRAADVAERQLEEKLEGGDEKHLKRVRGVVRRIWYGNMAREYYLSKYGQEAKQRIKDGNNLYVDEGVSQDSYSNAMEATIERFTNEGGQQLHEGEESVELGDDEAGREIKTALQNVIKAFAAGTMTPEACEAEKDRIMADMGKKYPDLIEKTRMYAENVFIVAEAVKNQVDAGADLDAVVANIKFYVDKAHTGARSEAELSKVDNMLEWLHEHHVPLANDATMAAALSIAYSVTRYSARTALGVMLKAVVPGVSTGILAGLNENKRFKKERAHHLRERAVGGEIEDGSKRREAMETTRYETASASDLSNRLKMEFTEVNEAGDTVERTEMTDAEYSQILDTLSEASARIRISDRQNIDLLEYSSLEKVEFERLELDLRIASAKVALRGQLSNPDSLDTQLEERVLTKIRALELDITAKDEVFTGLKRRAIGKAFAKGALMGMAFGTLGHEITSVLRPDEHGLLDSAIGHDKAPGAHQTLLRHMILGDHHKQVIDSSSPHAFPNVDGSHMMVLPDNVHLVPSAHSGYAIEGPGHHIYADNVSFKPDGSLDDNSVALLHHMGINQGPVDIVQNGGPQVEHVVPSNDFVAAHADKMVQVKRDGWLDADSSTPTKNALGLDWGGQNGSGLDSNGNIVMDISHMTPDGSYHAGLSMDAVSETQAGHIEAFVSSSKGTQQLAFEAHFTPNGQVVIDNSGDAARLFENVNGHEVFNGGYVEVAKVVSEENGIKHLQVLATQVGGDTGQVRDLVPPGTHTLVNLSGFPRTGPRPPIDVPWLAPQGRRGLETLKPRPERPQTPPESPADSGAGAPEVPVVNPPEPEVPVVPPTPETPAPPRILTLFEIKELARHNVAQMKILGDMSPEERGLIAANLGLITQHLKDVQRVVDAQDAGVDIATLKPKPRLVTETDIASMYSTFSFIRERHPELLSAELMDQVYTSLLDASAKIDRQTELGWGPVGVSAPAENPAASPLRTRTRRRAASGSSSGASTPDAPTPPIAPPVPDEPVPQPPRRPQPTPPRTPALAASGEPSRAVETGSRSRRTIAERNGGNPVTPEITADQVRTALDSLRETSSTLAKAFDLVDRGTKTFKLSEAKGGPELRSRGGVYRVRGADLLNAIQAYISLQEPSATYSQRDLESMSGSVKRLLDSATQPDTGSEAIAPPPRAVGSAEVSSGQPDSLSADEADQMIARVLAGEAPAVLAELGRRGFWRVATRAGQPVRVISDDAGARRVWDALQEARSNLGGTGEAAPAPLRVVPDSSAGVEEPVDSGRPARRRASSRQSGGTVRGRTA